MVKQVNVGAPPVGTATDISAVLKKLKEHQHSQKIPEGGWVVGWGYDPRELKENRQITKQDLDSVLPHHKVMIIHVSMHGAVLNSQALKWAGIDANTAKPAGGVIARVKGSNEPAGLLTEMAYLPVFKKLPRPSQEEMFAMMDPAQQLFLGRFACQGHQY